MKSAFSVQNFLLALIAGGVWVLALQNFNVLPADLQVRVGNKVTVSGQNDYGPVLDINLKYVNGWPAANYYEYELDGQEYHSIGVEYINNPPRDQ